MDAINVPWSKGDYKKLSESVATGLGVSCGGRRKGGVIRSTSVWHPTISVHLLSKETVRRNSYYCKDDVCSYCNKEINDDELVLWIRSDGDVCMYSKTSCANRDCFRKFAWIACLKSSPNSCKLLLKAIKKFEQHNNVVLSS